MAINIDYIVLLAKILGKDTFDDKMFNALIKTKSWKGFLEHENSLGREMDSNDIKEELKRLVTGEYYEDKYQLYKIKKNLNQLKMDIQYMEENKNLIIEKALKEIHKIVPKRMTIKSNIYLYGGGIDGGFTINRKEVFINYGKYIGQWEEFIKILSHELYHSRNIPIKNRIKFLYKMTFKTNRHIYEIIGKSIEEGIACLVQHGPTLKIDDLTGNLTIRKLVLSKGQFSLLNDILLSIKSSKPNNDKIRKLNIYVIGYIIVSTIYNAEGVVILDDWTENLEFRRIIKRYTELCNMNQIPSGFTDETVELIINQKSS